MIDQANDRDCAIRRLLASKAFDPYLNTTVADLKVELKERKLKVVGTNLLKPNLILRLLQYDNNIHPFHNTHRIGLMICKDLGGIFFDGKIASICLSDDGNGKEKIFYNIEYSDGDKEQMDGDDVDMHRDNRDNCTRRDESTGRVSMLANSPATASAQHASAADPTIIALDNDDDDDDAKQ